MLHPIQGCDSQPSNSESVSNSGFCAKLHSLSYSVIKYLIPERKETALEDSFKDPSQCSDFISYVCATEGKSEKKEKEKPLLRTNGSDYSLTLHRDTCVPVHTWTRRHTLCMLTSYDPC